ncbi:MAG: GGDEF domain-containing protein [Pseudomonadota bacterium]
MQALDTQTITLMTALSSGAMGIVLYSAHRSFPAGVSGLGYWSVGTFCFMLGRLLIWLRGSGAPEWLTVICANALLLAAIGLWLIGTEVFYGRRPNWWRFKLVVGIGSAGIFWWWAVQPDFAARVVCFALVYFACHSYLLVLVWRHGERHFATHFFGALLLVQALVALARSVGYLTLGMSSRHPFFDSHELDLIYMTSINFMSVMLVVAFMAVATHRLQTLLVQRSNVDPLTGILNRRGFTEKYLFEVSRMKRHQQAMSMLSIDLDSFKAINDTFGHSVGDQVLVRVTAMIARALRETDHLARFGGEEFVVLLPQTSAGAALAVATRIQFFLREARDAAPPACTASIGVVSRITVDDSLDAMLACSDAAMYRAKANGRDRIEVEERYGALKVVG